MPSPNPTQFDVIIIGGGPAGMSAALWCADLGLTSILLEKEAELGGQLLWTFNAIENYLGVRAANGHELRDRFKKHIAEKNIRHRTDLNVMAASLADKSVSLADGAQYSGRAVVIATGVRRRALGVPGEREFQNRGILDSGVKAKDEVEGKRVLVVGGGDAALENALLFCESAEKVYLIHRGSKFSARSEFRKRLEQSRSIEISYDHIVTDIKGRDHVEKVGVQEISSGAKQEIAVDNVLIRIGVVPNTEIFREQIELDVHGYIPVDADGSTSLEGTYAAGDVTSLNVLNISNAVGQGAAAAKVIYRKLMG